MADLNGLLKLIDSTTTARTWSYAISCLRPSMSQGEHVWLPIGKSLSTGNCGGIAFDYDDDNSNNNAVGIEIFGNRVATFNNYGNLTLKRPLGILYGGTGATTADGACENIGAVKKSGDTMTGWLGIQNEMYQMLIFKNNNGVEISHVRGESKEDGNRVVFRSTNLTTNKIEDYHLPIATATVDTWYDILTTKSPVTIAQGGTGATTPLQAIRNLGGMAELGYVDVNFLNDMTVPYNYSAVFINDLSTNNHIDIPVSSWFYVQHYSKSDGDGWAHQVFYEMGGSARIFHRISTHDTWYNSIEIPNALPIPVSQGGTGATTADGACGNIGAVKKSGDTMTGNLTIQTSHDPATMYRRADGTLRGYTLISDDNRYIVIQKHLNDDNLDLYYFPIVNSGSSAGYDVLTTKSTVTIAQGGTGATTADGACANLGAVKKSGDTLTGALSFANNTWNPVGDDVYIGDCNAGGCLGIKGQNGSSGLMFIAQDGNSFAKMYFDGSNLVSTNPIHATTFDCSSHIDINGPANFWYNNSTKLRLWTDNEGGNIMIVSPDGHEYQFDAYNNDQLRLFAYDNSNNLHSLVWSRTDGSLFVDRVYFGDALSTRESLHIYYRSATSDIASPSVGDICLVPV